MLKFHTMSFDVVSNVVPCLKPCLEEIEKIDHTSAIIILRNIILKSVSSFDFQNKSAIGTLGI